MALPPQSINPARTRNANLLSIARLCALISATALLVLLRQAAPAAASAPYGEVGRFGGYDGTGKVAGEFVRPVGFAVDPANEEPATPDKNAIFVLDQTVNKRSTGELQYRLQKLSSSGSVLGSVTLPLEHYTDTENLTDAHPLISLAVDASAHRVYALVENIVDGGQNEFVPVVGKLVAWSTEQNAQGELVRAAPGTYSEDSLTHASLVAEAALKHATAAEDLFAPEGIAVDPADHDVVIEAQQGEIAGSSPIGGPTILQRVATESVDSGQLDGSWVAAEALAPETEQADGIFTANDGSFGVDLFRQEGWASRLVDVKPNFATPESSLLAPGFSGETDLDEAPTIDGPQTANYRFSRGSGGEGGADLLVWGAGSPITQLSDGLYAARYAHGASAAIDTQEEVQPWGGKGEAFNFWTQSLITAPPQANEGIRLFEADGKIVTTIGGQPTGDPCNIDTQQVSLAAGAGNTLFALTQPNSENGNSDDQVIEFAEGGKGACPQASGQVTVDEQAGSSFTVHQDVPVDFDAISIERAGETPFEFEWNFTGAKTGSNDGHILTAKIEAPEYLWPNPKAEYTYTKAGTYDASLRLTGDYGTSTFPIEVKVLPSAPAVAEFEFQPASVMAGQSVSFNASASKGTPGSSVADYHWSFGDGSSEDTQTPEATHTYATAGAYEVALTITDEVKEEATKTHTVTVASPPPPPPPPPVTTTTGQTTTPPPTTTGQQPPVVKSAAVVPTRAQKLAKALKACKHKPKKQRASCERQARKQYGPPSHKKKTRKRKK